MSGQMLARVPCPAWLSNALAAHDRRRRLVLEVRALSDKRTAFFVLWAARIVTIRHPSMTVEDGLRAFKALLLR